jgi:hypothetical protein
VLYIWRNDLKPERALISYTELLTHQEDAFAHNLAQQINYLDFNRIK